MEDTIGRLHYPGEIRRFVLGGNSVFTLVYGGDTGRRTFKVKSTPKERGTNWSTGNQDKSQYFVSLRIGAGDAFSDYQYIGMLKEDKLCGGYRFDPKRNQDGALHGGAKLFDAFWVGLEQGCHFRSTWEFWHEGRCCMCGRALTVPDSIAAGIGPECAGKE